MRRTPAAVALLLAAATLHPAYAGGDPTVRVAVGVATFGYDDTTAPATYAVSCGSTCPRPRASLDVDTRRHEIRRARLGFSATRASAAAGAPEGTTVAIQQESVTVDVTEPGDLDVTLYGGHTATLDATPVAGSASQGGKVSGRTVRWHVGGARGSRTFTARFRVTADRTAVGSYTTRATVARTARTKTLFAYAWGAQPAHRAVRRVSTLTFAERVAPPYGAPHPGTGRWTGIPGLAGIPDVFTGSASLDAYGPYDAGASGVVGARSVLDLRPLVPGLANLPLSAGMGYSYVSGLVEEKYGFSGAFVYAPDGRHYLTGFAVSVCAERTGFGDGLTGATLYDRDMASISPVGDIAVVRAKRSGGPKNHRGKLVPVWTGGVASGSYEAATRSLLTVGETPRYAGFVHGANVHWNVTGGDLDNRGGDEPVRSAPVVVRVPKGETIDSAFIATSVLRDTEYDQSLSMTGDRRGMVIRAMVGPGGYWLRTTGRGFDRDWSTATSVIIGSHPAGGDGSSGLGTIRVVPPGTRTLVQYVVPGRPVRTALLDPGVWSVTGSRGGLDVTPLTKSDTTDCNSPL